MKLSEAIREGSKSNPQVVSDWITRGGTCAMGAAIVAVRGVAWLSLLNAMCETGEEMEAETSVLFPLAFQPAMHPLEYGTILRVSEIIEDLNDCQGWTREQIADWVATIEQAAEGLRITDELFDVRGAEALSADLGVLLLEAK